MDGSGRGVAFVVEHDCGLHVLAAGDEFGRPAPRDVEGIEQMLRCLNTLYDYVIVDAGSTLTRVPSTALQLSDAVMLVANPDVPCLRNLQRLIDALKLAGVVGERLQIVLNRTSEIGVLSTAQIEHVLGLNIDYSVSSDYRTVASAVNTGVPVSTLRPTELHAQLDAIARALAGRSTRRGRTASRARVTTTRRFSRRSRRPRNFTTVAPRCDSGASQ